MKIINNKLILVALIVFFSQLSSNAPFDTQRYRYFVTKISAEKLKKKATTQFTLSNQTDWFVSKDDRKIGTYPFQVGTEVFITPGSEEYHVSYFKPDGSKSLVQAWVSPYRDSLPKLVKEDLICLKKEGWFSSAQYIRIWELSDGSQWIINPKSTQFINRSEWKNGHRIIISVNLESQGKDWIMINTDQDKLFKVPQSWIDQGLYKKSILRSPMYLTVEPYTGDKEQIARNIYKY